MMPIGGRTSFLLPETQASPPAGTGVPWRSGAGGGSGEAFEAQSDVAAGGMERSMEVMDDDPIRGDLSVCLGVGNRGG